MKVRKSSLFYLLQLSHSVLENSLKLNEKPSFLRLTLKRQVYTITRRPLFCTPLRKTTAHPIIFNNID